MRSKVVVLMLALVVSLITVPGYPQDISSYLILTNIGSYRVAQPEKLFPGEPPSGGPRVYDGAGIIAGTGHFLLDHSHKTYEAIYFGPSGFPSPTVQVTQHAGGDSDRWLLHEVEDGYRDPDQLEANLTQGARLREINGNKFFSIRGSGYSWISNNIVVVITYTDLQGNKPEPLEVIQAYLQKHPSTIPATLVLDRAHDEQWIKAEMDRRLWLGDKWFLQIQTGKADMSKVLKEAVDHMNVFLDYRQKYFGVDAQGEKKALSGLQLKQDGAAIKKKLAEYKTWWEANKGRAINLQ